MISRTVLILSLVSFFTDISSEMLYPILPLYLKSIGFSIVWIGVLEGIAEAMAGLSKGYFGRVSDKIGKRLPFVQLGYALSAIAKPALVLISHPIWILFSRSVERLGKGIRTGARDAMLSSETSKENKAKIFGFHRGADTLGACLGPAIGLCYLYLYPEDYKNLFLYAFIPGILAIFFTFFLKERQTLSNHTKYQNSIAFLRESPNLYKKILIGLVLFAIFNSSDVFLLLRIKESGLSDLEMILVYIFYNLIYAILAYPMGYIADRFGIKKTFVFGLFIFSLVYFGMSQKGSIIYYLFLFTGYSLYAASTEGIAKAWIANICPRDTATAIGIYSGLVSIALLFASSIAGFLWYQFGAESVFYFSSLGSLMICIYFFRIEE
ncbi:MAG TPA: MFS transporter [Leptospiraceae bacterium]|nr:MFS transporter [Leptospiraceae bacterium]HMX32845.1 MFS transporter [Leptospiraceae bacterium]HMY33885.1 MFS transporter [Leptospiraceae bacterium]HMZ64503.1 MFS transporter [Leptospiraceae bacterium]HNA09942.1 MFS transporter [Leptospiraceae bacterium]